MLTIRRMTVALAIGVLVVVAVAARPTARGGNTARVASLEVKPSPQAGAYAVTASIHDGASGDEIMHPTLVVVSGEPALVESQLPDGRTVRFQISIDQERGRVEYSVATMSEGKVTLWHQASIQLSID